MPPFAEKGGKKKAAGFMGYNRNKKSLALNLRAERGQEIFRQLAHGLHLPGELPYMLCEQLRIANNRLPRSEPVRRCRQFLNGLNELVDVRVEAVRAARLTKKLIDAGQKIVADLDIAKCGRLNAQLGLNEHIDRTGEPDPAHTKAKAA
jgi:hypothetical protein